jgi:hypothetical protein
MERLFAKIKKETLNLDEKAEILSKLQIFVDQNPVRSIKSPFYSSWEVYIKQKTFIIPAVAIVIVLSLTGGTVLAAKSSLPGEMLYPVKILNEKVQSFTAVGPEAQAQVHASQAISRLQEVEQIVASNKQLDTATAQEIQNKFGAQAQEVMKNVDKLKNSGHEKEASKIQSDFKSSIAKHKKAIIELTGNGEVKGSKKNDH